MITAREARQLTIKSLDQMLAQIFSDIELMAKAGKDYTYTEKISDAKLLDCVIEKLTSLGYVVNISSENEIRISW